jgi:hypothetical protein
VVAEPKVHYAGALRWTNARGMTTDLLAGWAACCSGPRAARIRADGHNTYDVAQVTCGRCRRVLQRAAQGVETFELAIASLEQDARNIRRDQRATGFRTEAEDEKLKQIAAAVRVLDAAERGELVVKRKRGRGV